MLIFDLDGTLLNTLPDLHKSTNFALQSHALPTRTFDEVRQMVGNGVRRLMMRAAGEENFTEDLFQTFLRHYAQHCTEDTRPYDGIPETLRRLRDARIPMAVVSNKFDAAVQRIIAHYFPDTFQYVRGEVDGVPRKPDPTGTLLAVKALQSLPAGEYPGLKATNARPLAQTVTYIGDSDVDFHTARNAGTDLCLCTWGFRPRADLLALHAPHYAERPSDILQIVLGKSSQKNR